MNNGWISTLDKLPEQGEQVIAYDGKFMFVAWYDHTDEYYIGWHSSDMYFLDADDKPTKIIARHPIPEYREGKEC